MKYFEVEFKIEGDESLFTDSCDLITAMCGEVGFETFQETDHGVNGYVQQEIFDKTKLEEVMEDFPFDNINVTFEVREAEYKDLNEEWENEGFDPITISNECVVHDGRHLPTKDYAIEVEIDAKLAFGTGSHETTRMMARQLLLASPKDKKVLDCGCGTGILGIIALKAGASHVVGYDIDEWSSDNSRHNAVINGVGEHYQALLGDVSSVEGTDERFDLIMANINRNILIADMYVWHKLSSKNGLIILSGFYDSDVDIICKEAERYGMRKETIATDGDWACIVFRNV